MSNIRLENPQLLTPPPVSFNMTDDQLAKVFLTGLTGAVTGAVTQAVRGNLYIFSECNYAGSNQMLLTFSFMKVKQGSTSSMRSKYAVLGPRLLTRFLPKSSCNPKI